MNPGHHSVIVAGDEARSVTVATADVAHLRVAVRQRLSRDDLVMRIGIIGLGAWLVVTILLPLWALLAQSVEGAGLTFMVIALSVPSIASLPAGPPKGPYVVPSSEP